MNGRPLFIPLAAMIAGLLLAGLHALSVPPQFLLPLLLGALLAVFLPVRFPFLLIVSLLFFCWGNLSLTNLLQPQFPPNHITLFASEQPVTVEGVVDGRPEATDKGWRISIQAERLYRTGQSVTVSGKILLFAGGGRPEVATGDRVRFVSRLHRPRNYGLPGEFDYVRHLALKGIYATAFVLDGDDLVLVLAKVGHPLQRFIDDAAAGMGSFIGTAVPSEEGAILRALLLGERGFVPPSLEAAYAATGVNHILSISGFHVGIIALFIFHLLLGICRNSQFLALNFNLRKSLLIVTLPLIVFYLLLSGTAPATARSVIMITAWALALMVEREVEPVNSLLLAATLILAVAPGALFDVSFQLSFVALWGIIVLTPIFMGPFSRFNGRGIVHMLLLFTAASLAAICATLFPVAFYFHRVSFTGLIGNLVIVPLMGYGAVVLGFTALAFIPVFPFFAKLLLVAAAFLVNISNHFVLLLSNIPALPLLNPDRLDLTMFYFLLAVLTFASSRQIKIACSVAAAVAVAGNSLLFKMPDKGLLQITFFSLGQGESSLVRFPDGKTLLVDGGGSFREGGMDVGERLLAPALWSMGITAIDYMVMTHPHPDHIQGLLYIADNFKVGEFWEGRSAGDDSDYYRTLKAIIGRRRVPIHHFGATDHLEIGGARLEFLWPDISEHANSSLNDRSLVFRLVFARGSILFTGDIGKEVEKQLAGSSGSKSIVLKVPHHGSRYSSSPEFLQAVSPEIAVIAAGYGNSFHLPADETLARLKRQHVAIYRTDWDGTIQLVYDQDRGTFVPRRQNWHFN
ncbi:DNA internalization-related competence protein ComEC/Rec2 [Geotalea sp. SG265]|uniref:DNA internalization-related competence protein ComEC/Rec2 n=1 Tax=Geotalea sp. SG265 TaxID=2922867 RepID=UPI001FAEB3A0